MLLAGLKRIPFILRLRPGSIHSYSHKELKAGLNGPGGVGKNRKILGRFDVLKQKKEGCFH
jgi:hypothetical protein